MPGHDRRKLLPPFVLYDIFVNVPSENSTTTLFDEWSVPRNFIDGTLSLIVGSFMCDLSSTGSGTFSIHSSCDDLGNLITDHTVTWRLVTVSVSQCHPFILVQMPMESNCRSSETSRSPGKS